MPFEPVGSVCIVTGGASGIGRALCHLLASRRAKTVVVVDLNLDRAQHVAQNELPKGVGVAMKADCGCEMDLRRVIVRVDHIYGPIDAFFCNAGIASVNGHLGAGIDATNEEWDLQWRVNTMQSVWVARYLIPLCEKHGRGVAIVVTASAAGLLTVAGNLPYATTKRAAVAVAEWLKMTYYPTVQVACLCPQAVQTNMLDGQDPTKVWGGKIHSPEEVASVTLDALKENRFLVLPHAEIEQHLWFKAKNVDKWLQGMHKVHKLQEQELSKPRSKL